MSRRVQTSRLTRRPTSRPSRESLRELCEKAGIPPGSSLKDICQIMTERPKNFTKDYLVIIAKMLEISILPRDTKQEILKKLKQKLEQNPGKDDQIGEEVIKDIEKKEDVFEQKVVEENKKQNVNTVIVRDCIVYVGPRRLITVPVPEYAFILRKEKGKPPKKTWKLHSITGTGTYTTESTHCAFYFSTGTSNEGKNFSGMWFPFGRIKEKEKSRYTGSMDRGWIHKSCNLSASPFFLKALQSKGIVITEFMLFFLEKFSHWWQVGISACLPSDETSYWNTHEELIKLRPLAINTKYDWNYESHLIDKTPDEIVTQYELIADCSDTPEYKIPEKVNEWLVSKDAMSISQDSL